MTLDRIIFVVLAVALAGAGCDGIEPGQDEVAERTFVGTTAVTIHADGGEHYAAVAVRIVDADGQGAAGVLVHGAFLGDFDDTVAKTTNEDGWVGFKTDGVQRHVRVGFEIDGVEYEHIDGWSFGSLTGERVEPRSCYDAPSPD